MLLSCPSCETSFRVAPEALGAAGRMVRCARCHTSWFAAPAEEEVCEPALAEAPAFGTAAISRGEIAVPTSDESTWEDAPAESEAPPITPADLGDGDRSAPAAVDEVSEPQERPARRPLPVRPSPRKSQRHSLAVAACAAIAAFAILAVTARAVVVRAMPSLNGFYAAIGMPVNLRGLEFRGVRTASELQDGIAVLVIEGDVVNIAKRAVEVPRLRLAVLGNGGQELYSWTTLLPRSTLAEDEKVSFRSRLASPPPDGKEVLVRFLTRNDLTSR